MTSGMRSCAAWAFLLTEIALEAGCTNDKAREFGASMEEAIRDYVAEIEAHGGEALGTA